MGKGSIYNEGVPPASSKNEGVPPASSKNEEAPSFSLLLILKEESGVDLFSLSRNELRTRLLNGLILRDKKENTETKFYWLDDKSNSHCFMLLPKSLRINAGRGQVPRYGEDSGKWCTGLDKTLPWVKYEEVSRVNVGGKFYTMGLSGESQYEVVLFLQLIPKGGGSIYWAAKLSLPNGNQTQKPWARVKDISPEEWYPFPVGTFRMNSDNIGELSFDLQFGFWGSPDILIKGVAIKPSSVK